MRLRKPADRLGFRVEVLAHPSPPSSAPLLPHVAPHALLASPLGLCRWGWWFAGREHMIKSKLIFWKFDH